MRGSLRYELLLRAIMASHEAGLTTRLFFLWSEWGGVLVLWHNCSDVGLSHSVCMGVKWSMWEEVMGQARLGSGGYGCARLRES